MTVQDSIKRTLEIRASDAVESVRVLVNLRLGIRFSVLVQIQASIFYEIDRNRRRECRSFLTTKNILHSVSIASSGAKAVANEISTEI